MTQKIKSYTLFWAVVVGVLLLDQGTKLSVQWAYHNFQEAFGASLAGLARLVYVRNTGAAWGFLSGTGPYLGLLALGALVAIYYLRKPLQLKRPAMQVAFGFLCAGITGNMLDRLILGYVVDFIDLSFLNFSFPSFNIADVGITFGVAMYVLLGNYEPGKQKEDAEIAPASDEKPQI